MGMYLVSVAGADWTDPGEGGWAEVAAALDTELGRRGLPPYRAARAPERFEEKLVPPMGGVAELCRSVLTEGERGLLGDWTVLVPVSLPERIRLPFETSYDDEAVVAGAPEVFRAAERLAAAIGLPAEVREEREVAGALGLTWWILDGAAERLAAARPGPWSADLDASFHVALYLRAARHSIAYGCPLAYS